MESTINVYTYLFEQSTNPLTKDWLLISSPLPLVAIVISYNIFCIKIGPALMKHRPPFRLEKVIQLYNIMQVFVSSYMFYEGCVYLFSGNFNFKCHGVGEGEERVAKGVQVYFLTKLAELLDTVFFVLRKSYRQITFLHLFHHSLMLIVSWIGVKYFPGGQGIIFGTINCLVHVVMYGYYLLSAMGPQYQKYLWWKKYLTVMQIVQFIIVLLHSVNSLFYPCSYHISLKILTIIFASFFIYMFGKFYYHTYIAKKSSSRRNKIQSRDTNGKHSKTESSVSHKKDNYNNGSSNGCSTCNEVGNKQHTNGTFDNNTNSEQENMEKIKSL